MKKLILLAAIAALSGCSTMTPEQKFLTSNAADLGSTAAALSRDGIIEGNPLGLSGMIAAKVGVYAVSRVAGGQTECEIYKAANPITYGAVGNNLWIATGGAVSAALPFGILVGAAYAYFDDTECSAGGQNE
jgi:hypothetical protein